jgi:hypothetical protein
VFVGGHLFAHERRAAGRPRGGPGPQTSTVRSYGGMRIPEMAEITGAAREWMASRRRQRSDWSLQSTNRGRGASGYLPSCASAVGKAPELQTPGRESPT